MYYRICLQKSIYSFFRACIYCNTCIGNLCLFYINQGIQPVLEHTARRTEHI